jgi:tRNA A37 threonylcarbamoyladenosine modification protein TsaB
MILYIDSTEYNKITFAVSAPASSPLLRGNRGGLVKKSYKVGLHDSRSMIQKLEAFLRSSIFPYSSLRQSIKKIIVCSGPGSYTGIRVGIAHALALSLAWEIPFKALPKVKILKLLEFY